MMLAEVPQAITDVGVIAGAIIAAGAAVTLILRTPVIGPWIIDLFDAMHDRLEDRRRQRLGMYLDEFLPKHLEPVLHELRFNGGTSFRDGITREVRELRTEANRRFDRIERRLSVGERDREELRRLLMQGAEVDSLGREGRIDRRDGE